MSHLLNHLHNTRTQVRFFLLHYLIIEAILCVSIAEIGTLSWWLHFLFLLLLHKNLRNLFNLLLFEWNLLFFFNFLPFFNHLDFFLINLILLHQKRLTQLKKGCRFFHNRKITFDRKQMFKSFNESPTECFNYPLFLNLVLDQYSS